jgi:hypothetical protein
VISFDDEDSYENEEFEDTPLVIKIQGGRE